MSGALGPRPGQPGHIADHETLEAEILALDAPAVVALSWGPEKVDLVPPWIDYTIAGVYNEWQPLHVARTGSIVTLYGMVMASAATNGSVITVLPEWAWPNSNGAILRPLANAGFRADLWANGQVTCSGAVVQNGWYAFAVSWSRIDEEG